MEVKLEALRRFVTERQIDIFGFTLVGMCWKNRNILPGKLEDGGKIASGY